MPLPLSSIAIQEKNKLNSDSVFLQCVRVIVPGLDDAIRLVANSENIQWRHPEDTAVETYVACPFSISEINESTSNEVPLVTLSIPNVDRIMDQYLRAYDDYVKVNGYQPITVSICIINSRVVAQNPSADPEFEHTLELKQPKADAKTASFSLSASNPYTRRFPQNRILRNHCRFRFKSARCGYSGQETQCDHTLLRCRALGNSIRFGNAPGVGLGGFDVT